MTARSLHATLACLALAVSATACTGISSGVTYPGELPDPDPALLSPEGESEPSVSLGKFTFAPSLCEGIDTHTVSGKLTPEDLTRFLEARGASVEPKKARGNLYWFDFPNGEDKPDDTVRLRLAVLDSPTAAAKDLHDALLEHGPGWWGVRRGNLALLAPKTSLSRAVAFAVKYKLPCWGMFTVTGTEDAYVVPGPYMDL